jgi:sarcosine oxidase subunit alpha
VLIPDGAQLVAAEHAGTRPPVPMLGHVTSSYESATLGRTFALALLSGGRERLGETVYARAPAVGVEGGIAATVTEPIFYDPEGVRRDS